MTNEVKQLDNEIVKSNKKKKIASLDRRKARAGWLFVLPFLIGFVIIYLPMVFESIQYSFSKVNPGKSGAVDTLVSVGFANYKYALTEDPEFVKTLVTGLQQLIFDVPAIIIFSLFMAILLNQKMAGRGFFRAILFVPVILSTGIMTSIDAKDGLMSGMEQGIDDGSGQSTANELVSAMDLQMLFANMKVGTGMVDYVTDMINNIFEIVNRSGVQILIFLSSLQSISPAIYESCKIDGATSWETFWKITFPMITPMILVNGIYTIIDAFTSENNIVMTFIKNLANSTTLGADGEYIGAAMSWIYFLVVILIVGVIASIMSAFVFYQRKSE